MFEEAANQLKSAVSEIGGNEKKFVRTDEWPNNAPYVDICLQAIWNIADVFQNEKDVGAYRKQLTSSFAKLEANTGVPIVYDPQTYKLSLAYSKFLRAVMSTKTMKFFMALSNDANKLKDNMVLLDVRIGDFEKQQQFLLKNETPKAPELQETTVSIEQALLQKAAERRQELLEAQYQLQVFLTVKPRRQIPIDELMLLMEWVPECSGSQTILQDAKQKKFKDAYFQWMLPKKRAPLFSPNLSANIRFVKGCIRDRLREIQVELTVSDIRTSLEETHVTLAANKERSLFALQKQFKEEQIFQKLQAAGKKIRKDPDFIIWSKQHETLQNSADLMSLDKAMDALRRRLENFQTQLSLAIQPSGPNCKADLQQALYDMTKSYDALNTQMLVLLPDNDNAHLNDHSNLLASRVQLMADIQIKFKGLTIFKGEQELRLKKSLLKFHATEFFGNERELGGAFKAYLKEREQTFWARDYMSNVVSALCCCFGYHTEAQKREKYINTLWHETNLLIEGPVDEARKDAVNKTLAKGLEAFSPGFFSARKFANPRTLCSKLEAFKTGLQ